MGGDIIEDRLKKYKYIKPIINNIDLDIKYKKMKKEKRIELDILRYKLVKEQRIIEEAIDSLDKDKYKELIRLHYVESMKIIEISKLWGVTGSSVSSMKRGILKKLQKYLIANDTR